MDVYKRGEAAIPDYRTAIVNGGWDPETRLLVARVGEVIDIIWENSNTPTPQFHTHPLHMHGSHVWDLGSGNGTDDVEKKERLLRNFTPAERDTTLLYRYTQQQGAYNTTAGWRAWRLKVAEAGVFMMHCHSLQHMIMGEFANYVRLAQSWATWWGIYVLTARIQGCSLSG